MTLFSGVSHAAADLTLYVVDYPPHIFAADKDNVSGLDVEVVKQAFAVMGVSVDTQVMPWNRIVKLMQHGQIAGTIACSRRDYREQYMLFSDPISYVEPIALSKQSLEVGEFKDLQALKNFRVTTVEGWGMQTQLVQAKIPHRTAPDIESAIRAVQFRDVDILYMARYPALYYAKQMQLGQEVKVTSFQQDNALALHLCLSKDYPGAKSLKETFNQGLRAIKRQGDYNDLLDQYLSMQ
ncbi:substrate-binding periplasmic protein [Marinomonas ostreistagni]|uniref:substrate-binding periplasmic protein n=1 Tax=Marinomonas ostreistagni TaxID=359209 RepID=UPI00194F94E8|nr:transporter substrate-binding domain-containing protein [Marinomonas ostreistagni]MBM6549513.1 transporter substrate-binding domain-containing protein [Marinomonas ostreistagni]